MVWFTGVKNDRFILDFLLRASKIYVLQYRRFGNISISSQATRHQRSEIRVASFMTNNVTEYSHFS